jgi:hypothetical protein
MASQSQVCYCFVNNKVAHIIDGATTSDLSQRMNACRGTDKNFSRLRGDLQSEWFAILEGTAMCDNCLSESGSCRVAKAIDLLNYYSSVAAQNELHYAQLSRPDVNDELVEEEVC